MQFFLLTDGAAWTTTAAAKREMTAKDFIVGKERSVERTDGLFRVGDDVGDNGEDDER